MNERINRIKKALRLYKGLNGEVIRLAPQTEEIIAQALYAAGFDSITSFCLHCKDVLQEENTKRINDGYVFNISDAIHALLELRLSYDNEKF